MSQLPRLPPCSGEGYGWSIDRKTGGTAFLDVAHGRTPPTTIRNDAAAAKEFVGQPIRWQLAAVGSVPPAGTVTKPRWDEGFAGWGQDGDPIFVMLDEDAPLVAAGRLDVGASVGQVPAEATGEDGNQTGGGGNAGCRYHRMGANAARCQLRGLRVAFLGDSLLRNLFEDFAWLFKDRRILPLDGRMLQTKWGDFQIADTDINASLLFHWAPMLASPPRDDEMKTKVQPRCVCR